MEAVRGLVAAGIAAALALGGCQTLTDTFRCGTAATCGAGTCEPTGYCSFDDTGCAGGRRYGAAASEELANTCVGGVAPGLDGAVVDTVAPVVDAASPRTTRGLLALYTFGAGSVEGSTVHDVSGYLSPLDLSASASVTFTGGAAHIGGGLGLSSIGTASKIVVGCEGSDEVTIEAWVVPSSEVITGDRHQITGVMQNATTRDIALLEEDGAYFSDLRSDFTTGGGDGTMTTGTGHLRAAPTHLVMTRAAGGARIVYVDGAVVATATQPGTLDPWSTYALWIGNEPAGTFGYEGAIELIAFYGLALTADEVGANFDAGPDAGDD